MWGCSGEHTSHKGSDKQTMGLELQEAFADWEAASSCLSADPGRFPLISPLSVPLFTALKHTGWLQTQVLISRSSRLTGNVPFLRNVLTGSAALDVRLRPAPKGPSAPLCCDRGWGVWAFPTLIVAADP